MSKCQLVFDIAEVISYNLWKYWTVPLKWLILGLSPILANSSWEAKAQTLCLSVLVSVIFDYRILCSGMGLFCSCYKSQCQAQQDMQDD